MNAKTSINPENTSRVSKTYNVYYIIAAVLVVAIVLWLMSRKHIPVQDQEGSSEEEPDCPTKSESDSAESD